jgi:hypothetical protein
MIEINVYCHNPTLRECEDETCIPKMGIWESFGTPKISEFDYRGQNTSYWSVLYIIGKLLKSKMGSHEPFGHLQHKLWQKEKSGVKLAIWLSTTESWESTRYLCVQMECDMPLESSWWELQLCFRPHPDQRSEQEVMAPQSCRSPTLAVSGLPTPPGQNGHLDVGLVKRHIEYYVGEGGGFPQVQGVVSLVNSKSLVICPSTKGVSESELTNLLVGLM